MPTSPPTPTPRPPRGTSVRALLHRLPFALAITLALIVKLVLLFVLYKAFFSAPQVKKMRMPTVQVEQHLLSRSPAPAAALPAGATSAHPTVPSKAKP